MNEQRAKKVVICDWCESVFIPLSYKHRFCSAACQTMYHNRNNRHSCGPCPTCGKLFQSRSRTKKFCSLKCYLESDQFRDMSLNNIKKSTPMIGVLRVCKGCGKEYSRSRKAKFCSRLCRRKYFSERFDRWIANPESVALPQNFDEFLNRDVLPCPIVNCEWEGEFLGAHVNMEHGISAREFKKLCGFNLTTGLVGNALSRQMSEKAKKFIAEGVWSAIRPGGSHVDAHQPYVSLEAKEHGKKTRAEMATNRDVFVPCRECGAPVQQPSMGRKLYCSTKCRSDFYYKQNKAECRCAYCGESFIGNRHQSKREKRGLPVCCSMKCRNRLNIVAALSSRGISWTKI